MHLELQQLDLRYESLRIRHARRERRLLASLSDVGQLVPIVVVASEARRYVVIDGYARVRGLRQLSKDTVRAIDWNLSEVEALLLSRSMRSAEGETILEQSWLLSTLKANFGLDQQELAERFERSQSWVSRRLALIGELPQSVQDEIRQGRIGAHAAAKYLVPMARSHRRDCECLARAIAKKGFSSREVGELYAGWRDGSIAGRKRLIEDPELFLKVRRNVTEAPPTLDGRDTALKEVRVIGCASQRLKTLSRNPGIELSPLDCQDVLSGLQLAMGEIRGAVEALRRYQSRSEHAQPEPPDGDPRAA